MKNYEADLKFIDGGVEVLLNFGGAYTESGFCTAAAVS